MVSPCGRVVVVVVRVVDRDSHLGRISVIHVVRTSIVRLSPEVLRIVYVRIMIESIPILSIVRAGPSSILPSLSLGVIDIDEKDRCSGNDQ